uniref:Androgen-binding protein homolog n=1 Tax=Bos mutus grunniens TaxID=30521 RepID=A0A8B9YJJ1_BOSMU
MKGALLVLTLLVTRELTFKTTDACPVFYGGVAALLLGSETVLNSTFDLVDSTDEEKAAFGKVQDCFNEAGFDAKLKVVEIMVIYSPDPDSALPTHMHSILDSLSQHFFPQIVCSK